MRLVVEGSKQGVVVRGEDELLYCNDAFARMIGYETMHEVMQLGRSKVNGFLHPEDVPMIVERLN